MSLTDTYMSDHWASSGQVKRRDTVNVREKWTGGLSSRTCLMPSGSVRNGAICSVHLCGSAAQANLLSFYQHLRVPMDRTVAVSVRVAISIKEQLEVSSRMRMATGAATGRKVVVVWATSLTHSPRELLLLAIKEKSDGQQCDREAFTAC